MIIFRLIYFLLVVGSYYMKILIGITGGIDAYKIYELIKIIMKNEDKVKVILTKNAQNFVTPLVIESLSMNRCYTDMFESRTDMSHVELAEWADVFIIAPATANIIGKIANGIADDLLSTSILALHNIPSFIFPGMSPAMLESRVVQENLDKLRALGHNVIEPADMGTVFEETRKGKLPEPEAIFNFVRLFFKYRESEISKELTRKKVLITAGATSANLDSVRYISGRSLGRMGVELAGFCYLSGAKVDLIVNRELRTRFSEIDIYAENIIEVETTEQVLEAAGDIFDDVDIYINSAVLCDFKNEPDGCIIKNDGDYFELKIPTGPDIFRYLTKRKSQQVMVGFTLEAENLEEHALKKLEKRNMDIIIANSPSVINAAKSDAVILSRYGDKEELKEAEKSTIIIKTIQLIYKVIKSVKTDRK
jgi:phosphopantothenoylcysteine decarboxylase/phosphopantothenate--cysteine ligase